MNNINTNIGALKASNASSAASKMLSTSMERLSTGKRINSSKDDAAGLAIANSMTAQIRGMNQGIRNANDGISLAQTADGALNEATNILQRMNELAVQSASGTYQDKDRGNLQVEVTELASQLKDVMGSKFNGVALFGNTDKSINIHTGASSTDNVTLKIGALDLSVVTGSGTATAAKLGDALLAGDARVGTKHVVTAEDVAYAGGLGGGGTFAAFTTAQIGAEVTLDEGARLYEPPVAADGLQIGTQAEATTALSALSDSLSAVNTTRASLGAGQSRLESAVSSLTTNVTNLSDARSRIEDTDYSTETTALAKAQILSQASSAMLAQANQSQQSVLSLLR